jgi:hypothetical protein
MLAAEASGIYPQQSVTTKQIDAWANKLKV